VTVPQEEIARFYTRSRRFPKMIGRMNDGSRIPGGPYTLTQVGVGGAVLLVMLVTRGLLWSTGEILLDLLVTAGVAFAATWLVGRIPMTRRNLLFAFLDGAAAMFKPFGGKYQGQTIRLAQPHAAGGDTQVLSPRPARRPVPSPLAPETARKATPMSAPQPRRQRRDMAPAAPAGAASLRPETGVERLLAQINSTTN